MMIGTSLVFCHIFEPHFIVILVLIALRIKIFSHNFLKETILTLWLSINVTEERKLLIDSFLHFFLIITVLGLCWGLWNASWKNLIQHQTKLLSRKLLSYDDKVLTESGTVSTAVDFVVIEIMNAVLYQFDGVDEEFLLQISTVCV